MWDISSQQRVHALRAQSEATCMAVFPSERAVVGGYEDGTIRVWDIEKESSLMTIKGHFGPVTLFQFHRIDSEWFLPAMIRH